MYGQEGKRLVKQVFDTLFKVRVTVLLEYLFYMSTYVLFSKEGLAMCHCHMGLCSRTGNQCIYHEILLYIHEKCAQHCLCFLAGQLHRI